ncbi:MAG: DUF2299 family protein [Promethearchaeota archaeon]
MSTEKSKIENLIQEYLLEDGLLRERLPDPNSKLDFGFVFTFPPGPKSQKMSILKPKNKNYIIIAIRTQISKPQINALNSLKGNKKMQFFIDLRKFLLIKEVFFRIDIPNYIYEINDQLYLNSEGIVSKDSFFKTIRKILYCFVYSNIILGEYLTGKEVQAEKFDTDFDLSLYT